MRLMGYIKVTDILLWTSFTAAILVTNTLDAQGSRRPVLEKLEAQRVAYITNELELSTQEAQSFWPVYNEFKAEEEAMKASFRGKFSGPSRLKELSDEEAQKHINSMLEFEQKQLDLKVKYTKKLIAVLPVQKVAMLPEAERGFREKIVRRISERNEWRRN